MLLFHIDVSLFLKSINKNKTGEKSLEMKDPGEEVSWRSYREMEGRRCIPHTVGDHQAHPRSDGNLRFREPQTTSNPNTLVEGLPDGYSPLQFVRERGYRLKSDSGRGVGGRIRESSHCPCGVGDSTNFSQQQ